MAIILYTSTTQPDYITDGGHFANDADGSRIGIGSGGGTELTKAELIARQKTMPNIYMEFIGGTESKPDGIGVEIADSRRDMTDAEIEAMVNAWCTRKGIS